MKKLISLVLVLIFALSFCSCFTEEPETFIDGDFEYTLLYDGTYSVGAANPDTCPAEIVIPTTYNGVAVVEITGAGFS